MNYEEATYQCTPSKSGEGTFFFTDCCKNTMYSVSDNWMTYHGCLCPGCLFKGKYTVLYLRGTEEANRVLRVNSNKEFNELKEFLED